MFSATRAVEQEVVLQHDAELLAVVAQPHASPGRGRRRRIRPLSGRLNAITRLISVLLPDPLDPTSAVVVPAGARKLTSFSTGVPGVVLEADVLEHDLAARSRRAAPCAASSWSSVVICSSSRMRSRPGERLADLRADRRHLDDRRRQQAGEEDVVEELADRHRARPGSTRPPTMIMMTPMMPMIARRERGDRRHAGDRLRHVAEQAVRALA